MTTKISTNDRTEIVEAITSLDMSPEQEGKFWDQFVMKLESTIPDNSRVQSDILDWKHTAPKCFGTFDEDVIQHFMDQLAGTCHRDQNEEYTVHFNKLIPIMRGIQPQDEIEGMLACQMVGVHNLAMDMIRDAQLASQGSGGVNAKATQATELLRTFTAQMEALQQYRGKCRQES